MRTYLLDANLLVLLIVGMVDPKIVGKHKRTRHFDIDDFDRLTGILEQAKKIRVTPHCLAEASNLLVQGEKHRKPEFLGALRALMSRFEEIHVPGEDACARQSFLRLGLTDAGLEEVAELGGTLLTVDLALYLQTLKLGLKAINFNHLRSPSN